jgi:tetratricopeptide (TPR) repeat protein
MKDKRALPSTSDWRQPHPRSDSCHSQDAETLLGATLERIVNHLTNEELRERIERFDFPRDEIIVLCRLALKRDPDFQLAHRELGWAFCGQDEIEKAEYHIQRAIELDPADGWARIYLGNVLWRRFEYEAAEAAFQTAISLWPDSSVPYWCLAMFYDYENRPRLAARFYRWALEIDPNDTVALYRYGHFLRSQHRSIKAKRIFQRLLSIEPANEHAIAGLYEATLESQHR